MVLDITLFTLIILADRVTKLMIPKFMALHESIPLIKNFFHLTYVRNMGGAFGVLAGWDSPLRRVFFIVASIGALVLLGFLYKQALSSPYKGLRLSLVAIAGGAIGNLYDRLLMGEVVDFLDVFVGRYHWPAFNVADSAITVGACVLFFYYLTGRADQT